MDKSSRKVSWTFLLFLNIKMNGHKEDYIVQLEYAINLLSKVWQIDWVEKIRRRKIYFVFYEKVLVFYVQELNVRTLYHVCSAVYSSVAFLRTHQEWKSSHPLPLQAITFSIIPVLNLPKINLEVVWSPLPILSSSNSVPKVYSSDI